jgi:dTDP-glucose 4,6-dehydratase
VEITVQPTYNSSNLFLDSVYITTEGYKIKFTDLPQDDPTQREPSITKAIEHLGWKPSISRIEGIKCTIDYIKASKTD